MAVGLQSTSIPINTEFLDQPSDVETDLTSATGAATESDDVLGFQDLFADTAGTIDEPPAETELDTNPFDTNNTDDTGNTDTNSDAENSWNSGKKEQYAKFLPSYTPDSSYVASAPAPQPESAPPEQLPQPNKDQKNNPTKPDSNKPERTQPNRPQSASADSSPQNQQGDPHGQNEMTHPDNVPVHVATETSEGSEATPSDPSHSSSRPTKPDEQKDAANTGKSESPETEQAPQSDTATVAQSEVDPNTSSTVKPGKQPTTPADLLKFSATEKAAEIVARLSQQQHASALPNLASAAFLAAKQADIEKRQKQYDTWFTSAQFMCIPAGQEATAQTPHTMQCLSSILGGEGYQLDRVRERQNQSNDQRNASTTGNSSKLSQTTEQKDLGLQALDHDPSEMPLPQRLASLTQSFPSPAIPPDQAFKNNTIDLATSFGRTSEAANNPVVKEAFEQRVGRRQIESGDFTNAPV